MCLMNELTMAVPESTMPSLTTKAFCKVWTYASACANPDWSWKNGTKYPAIGVMTIIFPTWMQYFKPIPLHKVRFGSFQFTFDFGCSIIIAKAIFFLAKLASLSSIFSILQGTLSQWIFHGKKYLSLWLESSVTSGATCGGCTGTISGRSCLNTSVQTEQVSQICQGVSCRHNVSFHN